jgi:hypothetical protein
VKGWAVDGDGGLGRVVVGGVDRAKRRQVSGWLLLIGRRVGQVGLQGGGIVEVEDSEEEGVGEGGTAEGS